METSAVFGLCFLVFAISFMVGLIIGIASHPDEEKIYKDGWRDGKNDKPRNLTAKEAWMIYDID